MAHGPGRYLRNRSPPENGEPGAAVAPCISRSRFQAKTRAFTVRSAAACVVACAAAPLGAVACAAVACAVASAPGARRLRGRKAQTATLVGRDAMAAPEAGSGGAGPHGKMVRVLVCTGSVTRK